MNAPTIFPRSRTAFRRAALLTAAVAMFAATPLQAHDLSALSCLYSRSMSHGISPDKVDPIFLAKQLAQPRIARYFGQQAI